MQVDMTAYRLIVTIITSSREECKVLWWVCLSVCPTRKPNFSNFVYVASGHGSILLWQRCDTICTSGFVDTSCYHIMALWRVTCTPKWRIRRAWQPRFLIFFYFLKDHRELRTRAKSAIYKVKRFFCTQRSIMSDSRLMRSDSGMTCGITQFYQPPYTHTCIHTWNEPRLLTPQLQCIIAVSLEGWVGLDDLVTKIPRLAYQPNTVTNPCTNRSRRRVTSLTRLTMLSLNSTGAVSS